MMNRAIKTLARTAGLALAGALCACSGAGTKPQLVHSDLPALRAAAAAAYEDEDMQASEALYLQRTRRMDQAAHPWFRLGNVYARTGGSGLWRGLGEAARPCRGAV